MLPRYLVVSTGGRGYSFRGMIKAVLLIFEPLPTWDKIVAAQKKWSTILVTHVIPLLLLTSAVEGFGLIRWGKPRGEVPHLLPLTMGEMLVFEAAQILESLVVVFLGAKLLKSLGETFHGRHSLGQTFRLTAYSLSPLFLMRLLDVFPFVSPWTPWAIGIVLTGAVLYNGLPKVMQPDPPHAFGLYFMSMVILFIITGLGCFLTTWYLQGKFTKLDAIVSHLLSAPPH
jgi:hypothetical protein